MQSTEVGHTVLTLTLGVQCKRTSLLLKRYSSCSSRPSQFVHHAQELVITLEAEDEGGRCIAIGLEGREESEAIE